jgi:hypothetical protein
MILGDLLIPNRSWWTSVGLVGSLFTGPTNFNIRIPPVAPMLVGVLLILAASVLIGVGFTYYMPLFRRLKLNPLLGGAIYGVFLWIVMDLLFLNPLVGGRLNLITLLVANVLGGVIMGWWLSRPQEVRSTPEATT